MTGEEADYERDRAEEFKLQTKYLDDKIRACEEEEAPVHSPGDWYAENARQSRELMARIDLALHLGNATDELRRKLERARDTGD